MSTIRPHRPVPLRGVARLAWSAAMLAALMTSGAAAHAQPIRPWVPPAADSLIQWAAESKVRFQSNQGDSVGGANFRAYELVGAMGRRLIRSLGKGNMSQAHAIKTVLDSLGLDTDVLAETEIPNFVLVMVRNPYQRSAEPVGFLYWYKVDDLRMQGVQFRGGMRPTMKVWWTGNAAGPYEWGIVDRARATEKMHLTLLQLAPSGMFWRLVQSADSGPDLGLRGEATWIDINGDQRPELVAWVSGTVDSMFQLCSDCPKLIDELIFTEGSQGFHVHDTRIVPSSFATFTLFIRLLTENNRAAAARLLAQPAKLEEAITLGWGARRAPKTWVIEDADHGSPWPAWLQVRFHGAKVSRRYTIHFQLHAGRWIIYDWIERSAPGAAGGRSSPEGRK